MPRKTIEDLYADVVEEGHCTMDSDDLRAMDLKVYTMSEEQYQKVMKEWEELGRPEFPIFPREDT
jgi:hypothetical protein